VFHLYKPQKYDTHPFQHKLYSHSGVYLEGWGQAFLAQDTFSFHSRNKNFSHTILPRQIQVYRFHFITQNKKQQALAGLLLSAFLGL